MNESSQVLAVIFGVLISYGAATVLLTFIKSYRNKPERVPSEYEERVRRALTEISLGDLSSVGCHNIGICGNILYEHVDGEHSVSSQIRRAITDMMDTWPLGGNVPYYPIWPYSDSRVPMWQGKQLEQRQALCLYILENWDEVIANANS